MSDVESRPGSVAIDRDFSRRNFLKTAAGVGAALAAAGIGGIGFATKFADAQGTPAYTTYQDLGAADIVAFAYQLELLEGTFYANGVNAGVVTGSALTQIAEIRDHEMAHADALAGILNEVGAAVPATPTFTYPDGVFADPTAFLNLAATFEPVGIGSVPGGGSGAYRQPVPRAALSIHSAECQHWNAIKVLQGIVPPNNVAFEEALPLQQVQQAVAPFGV